MEVSGRHARTRAITRDMLSPADQPVPTGGDASRDVANVVSDVSVLCPRPVAERDNSWRRMPRSPDPRAVAGTALCSVKPLEGARVVGWAIAMTSIWLTVPMLPPSLACSEQLRRGV